MNLTVVRRDTLSRFTFEHIIPFAQPQMMRAILIAMIIALPWQVTGQAKDDPIVREGLSGRLVLLMSCNEQYSISSKWRTVEYGLMTPDEMIEALGGIEARRDSAVCVRHSPMETPIDIENAIDLALDLGCKHILCVLESPPKHVINELGMYVAALYPVRKGMVLHQEVPILLVKAVSYKNLCKKVGAKIK